MWPLWLIVAVAGAAVVVLTTSGVLVAVYIERKRYRRMMAQQGLDRSVSQYQRPHLSINDVDIANLPRPTRSLRHSVIGSRRDSRFYSTMPSEDEIRTFPDGSTESLAEAGYIHDGTDHQWLNLSKSKKDKKRSKKQIKLSISAPMAKSPMSAISEQTETSRLGSPEPVELPANITPRVTPERTLVADNLVAVPKQHAPQGSLDSILSAPERTENRISTRINNGTTMKSRSISLGSIAPPPNCPLPPVPEDTASTRERTPSMTRSKSELSTHRRNVSLLNSAASPKQAPIQDLPQSGGKSDVTLAGFNFGLKDEKVQIIRVELEQPSIHVQKPSYDERQMNPSPYEMPARESTSPQVSLEFQTIDASSWNVPRGLRHLGSSTPLFSPNISDPGSRPISAMSAMSLSDYKLISTTQSSPTKSTREPPSRPVSISSVEFFRQSVIGPNVPVLAPESPRTRGHRRQNCMRISGLTPFEHAKKRLSSQLDRLAEAEETDGEDTRSVGIEIPTISPARPRTAPNPVKETKTGEPNLEVPKIRQPQALSLRMKRPGLIERSGTDPITPVNDIPPIRPSNPIGRAKTTTGVFVYAGSPASDPTRPPSPLQEFSPVSPSTSPKHVVEVGANASTPNKHINSAREQEAAITYSPASPSMLLSASTSPVHQQAEATGASQASNPSSPRRNKPHTLHGPRSAPAPSLRTSRNNGMSSRLRQTSDQRSTSPIRKASQPRATAIATPHKSSNSFHDELRRSTALLKSLTHAAEVGKGGGLPEVNVIRTPSSRYGDSPLVNAAARTTEPQPRGTRQRSRTVGSTLAPPKFRQEATYPPLVANSDRKTSNNANRVSIWEDLSVRGDSDGEDAKVSNTEGQALDQKPPSRLQQSADVVPPRALTYKHNVRESPKTVRERRSKFEGYWGDKSQTKTPNPTISHGQHQSQLVATDRPPVTKTRTPSAVQGPRTRQRSHTVSAITRPHMETSVTMRSGVGLGVDFGRTGLGAGMSSHEAKGGVFLNEMERDGIGQLR